MSTELNMQDWSFSSMSVAKHNENFPLFWLEGRVMAIELQLITTEWVFFVFCSRPLFFTQNLLHILWLGDLSLSQQLCLAEWKRHTEVLFKFMLKSECSLPHRGANYCPDYQGGKETNMNSRKPLHTPYCQGGPSVVHTVIGCEVFKHLEAGQLYLCIFNKAFTNIRVRCILADGLTNDTAILRMSAMKITS